MYIKNENTRYLIGGVKNSFSPYTEDSSTKKQKYT